MPFKPSENQEFHIIARHSGKAIGLTKDSIGVQLTQLKFDPEDGLQKFRFAKEDNSFWMMMRPYKERFVAVHNRSLNEDAPAISWQWEPRQLNLKFNIEPAYDGYYRIKAVHSQKFLEVLQNSKEEGAKIGQHAIATTENQLFSFVPAIDNAVSKNPTSFDEYSDLLRMGSLKIISLIPTAGEPLSFIIGLFWTEHNKLSDMWEQMKNYVDVRVRELIMEERLKTLREMLEGELKLLAEIQNQPGLKGESLKRVMYSIVEKEPHFMKQPKEVLPYLVGLGTIMINLRRMMVVNYKELFGSEPDAATLAANKTNLKKSIKDYTDAVNKSKKDLLKWRLAFIHDRTEDEHKGTVTSVAWDPYDGNWAQRWSCYHGWDGIKDHAHRCNFAIEQRRKYIETQYKMEMEEYFRGAFFWQFYDVDAKPYNPGDILVSVGIFGGPYATNSFKGENVGLTRVDVFTRDGMLCGLEIFYTHGQSFGLKGSKGNASASLALGSDEYITSINLYSNLEVEGIWFTTQKGRTVGGGRTTQNTHFNIDLPGIFNPRLAVISGAWNADKIEQLSFDWLCTI